ncbi:hypothetical protein [Priestia megaterium]|uniref:hypothetical protein n=1 Tax=Priestia megaterium TaxID=1404 RepID=UPI00366B2AB3
MHHTSFDFIPVPYIQIDEKWNILACSKQAYSLFPPKEHFLDIVHVDDNEKAQQLLVINPSNLPSKADIRLRCLDQSFNVFTCRMSWSDGIGHLVCTETRTSLQDLEQEVKVTKQLLTAKQALLRANETLLKSHRTLMNELKWQRKHLYKE